MYRTAASGLLKSFKGKRKSFWWQKICLEMTEAPMQDRLTRETASLPQNEISQVGEMCCNHVKYLWNNSALWGRCASLSTLLTHEFPAFGLYLCTILAWGALYGTLLLRRCSPVLWSLSWRVLTAAGFLSRKIPRPWLEQLGLQIQISSSAERMSLLQ